MKKLFILCAIIGLMTAITTKSLAQCNGGIIHLGWSEYLEKSGMYPARVNVSADYWKEFGFVGALASFPSKADDRLSVGLRGGFHLGGYYVVFSPYAKVSYDYSAIQRMSGKSVGYGAIINIRFMKVIGIYADISQDHMLNMDGALSIEHCKKATLAFGVAIFI